MREPSLRTSRLAIASGLAAVIAVAGIGFFLGRTTSPTPKIAEQTAPLIAAAPPKVEAPRLVGRADLVWLANRAADAMASGERTPPEVSEAAGRRFEVVLPFGCKGAAPEGSEAPLRWRYDDAKQTLRAHVAPTRWSPAEWGIAAADDENTSIEGFWVERPWSAAERCPEPRGDAAPVDAQPVTLPGQTLAIAQIFNGQGLNNDRPYEIVQRVTRDDFSGLHGLRLRLIGRIENPPNGSTVSCRQPAGIDQRPVCLVAASFDEIRLENPDASQPLATWSVRRNPSEQAPIQRD